MFDKPMTDGYKSSHHEIAASIVEELDLPHADMTAERTRWHHQRTDVKDHPDGLAAYYQILVGVLIIALAGVFDALTSLRNYRPTVWPEKASMMLS
jgi:response regulator RpfG family c-di-GMP phosphodiesterase